MDTQSAMRIIRDLMAFGPQVLRVYWGAKMGTDRLKLDLRGVGNVTVRTRDSDMDVMRDVFIGHQYELPRPQADRLAAVYDRIRAAGRVPVIIDAGANIGAASIWFAKHYPDAKVVAVEPDATNAELCRLNTADKKQVQVIESAIGGSSGTAKLSPGQYSVGVQTVRGAGSGAVEIKSVTDIMANAGPDAELFLVKVDIEGFEADLFASNTDWIGAPAAIYVEPHDWMLPGRGSSRSLQKTLCNAGFELLIVGENLVFVRDEPGAVLN